MLTSSVFLNNGFKKYLIIAAWAAFLIIGYHRKSLAWPTDREMSPARSRPAGGHAAKTAWKARDVPLTVIIAALQKDNLTTLGLDSGLRPGDEQIVYVADDPNATHSVPMNKGNEAMVYLSFLIDRYYSLPEAMAFMHAGRTSYHNNHLLHLSSSRLVRNLRTQYVRARGFVNLGCDWSSYCTRPPTASASPLVSADNKQAVPGSLYPISVLTRHPPSDPRAEYSTFAMIWASLFPGQPVPPVLGTVPGGQFALSREAALRVPLRELKRLRQWIIETDYLTSKDIGAVFEMLWHVLFLGWRNALLCPAQHDCYCELYGICLHLISDGPGRLCDSAIAEGRRRENLLNRIQTLQIIAARPPSELQDTMLSEYSNGRLQHGLKGFPEYLVELQRNISAIESHIDGIAERATIP
ncbi:hypothetical protein BJX68DRAFT_270822 [Aspergillus pseudodeflectus]|uniref:Uncharacterized protein n=1 Tax=Aspergillus pseudodeflectus TaxID=176178 RepID=A0ABR4JPZ5_9EURO